MKDLIAVDNLFGGTLAGAIDTFGKDSQCRMAIEEMSELTKAICKHLRNFDNLSDLVEEIADVEIMMAQLEIIFGCSDKVETWIDYKLERLQERINSYNEMKQEKLEGDKNDG